MALRRTLLISTGVIALGGAWVWAAFINTGDYRLGQARLMPPLLRARFGEGERLFGLLRRRETEVLPALSLRTADSGERVEIVAWSLPALEPVFAAPLLSITPGAFGDGGILGEQNATIWIHVGGLGAASAVDGRMLADMDGILARNTALFAGMPESRSAYRFENGLEFTDRFRATWRLDPRNFNAAPVRSPAPAGLATPQAPAPWHADGIRGSAEARLAGVPIGVVAAIAPPGIAPSYRLGPGPSKIVLARSQVADAPPAPAAPAGGKPVLVPRPTAAEAVRLVDVPVEEGPIFDAMLLTELGARALADPPGVLALYRTAPNGPLRLARIGADGTVAWRLALPLASANTLLPGDPVLVLAGRKAGSEAASGTEAIVAVDLSAGTLRARDTATGEAISA